MQTLETLIDLYKKESAAVFSSVSNAEIIDFVEVVWKTYQSGGTVFSCGNGGNAGFVANLVSDFALHPFVGEDKSKAIKADNRLAVIDLCASSTMVTGLLNDLGPEYIFSGQIEVYAKPGDLIIGFSGSGNSANILEAFKKGRERGTANVLITRKPRIKCSPLCDVVVEVPGTSVYPGQTGKNDNNFHFEDCLAKITHLATGILKGRIQDELRC